MKKYTYYGKHIDRQEEPVTIYRVMGHQAEQYLSRGRWLEANHFWDRMASNEITAKDILLESYALKLIAQWDDAQKKDGLD